MKEDKENWFDRWISDEHPDIRARASNILASKSEARRLQAKDEKYDPRKHKSYSIGSDDNKRSMNHHVRKLYQEEKNHFFSFWDRARAFELYNVDDTRRLAASATFADTAYDAQG